MLTQLVGGLRHIRGPLAIGYCILLAIWILVGERVPTNQVALQSDNVATMQIARVISEVGSTGTIATITTFALLIGSVFTRGFPDRLFKRARWSPDTIATKDDPTALRIVESALDAQERISGEFEFRILLGMGFALLSSSTLLVDAVSWSIAMSAIAIALAFDAFFLRRNAGKAGPLRTATQLELNQRAHDAASKLLDWFAAIERGDREIARSGWSGILPLRLSERIALLRAEVSQHYNERVSASDVEGLEGIAVSVQGTSTSMSDSAHIKKAVEDLLALDILVDEKHLPAPSA